MFCAMLYIDCCTEVKAQESSYHGNTVSNSPPMLSIYKEPEQQGMLGSLPSPSSSVGDCNPDQTIAVSSDGDTEGEEDESSDEEDDISAVLGRAGVELDMNDMQGEGKASLLLLSEVCAYLV